MSKENIKNCIDSILEKDFSNAKLIIAEKFVNHSNEKTIGIKFALEGIISKHSGKNSMNKESSEYLKLINNHPDSDYLISAKIKTRLLNQH